VRAVRTVLGALGAVLALAAAAQTPPPCPAAEDVRSEHLLGFWRAEFEGLAQGATLLLEKHAEYAEMVSGGINRNGDRALLTGDIDGGELTLEESVNGVNISATWLGDVVEGSCGREIRGNWQAEGGPRPYPFVLRKR
jgi:hypothetical protein